jgi:hypothetical protein
MPIDLVKILERLPSVVSFIANVFTITASAIAIYIFIFKRETISTVFKVLLNYSFQLTLSELKAKLERLNDLSVNDSKQVDEVINILNEIVGQIRGNKRLRVQCAEILSKLEPLAENPKKLTEPRKRSLISELRESLRHIDFENYDQLMGGAK